MSDISENTGSAFGVILGILGLVWLATYLSKKRCPICNCENPSDAIICFNCRSRL
jgi:hypothetical protein